MRGLGIGIAVVIALLGAGSAMAAGGGEEAVVLRVTKSFERDWLAHRTHASCSHYTGAAKRRLVSELGVSPTCEGTLRFVFGLLGPEDAAKVRNTMRSLTTDDVSVDHGRARVSLSGERVLRLRRIAGSWYISDPSTTS